MKGEASALSITIALAFSILYFTLLGLYMELTILGFMLPFIAAPVIVVIIDGLLIPMLVAIHGGDKIKKKQLEENELLLNPILDITKEEFKATDFRTIGVIVGIIIPSIPFMVAFMHPMLAGICSLALTLIAVFASPKLENYFFNIKKKEIEAKKEKKAKLEAEAAKKEDNPLVTPADGLGVEIPSYFPAEFAKQMTKILNAGNESKDKTPEKTNKIHEDDSNSEEPNRYDNLEI